MRFTSLDLTFYGMHSSISEYVKMVIEDRAEAAGINLNIKEIIDPDAFIKESITSVPAIKVGTEIRSMEKKDPVKFARETSQWILEKSSYGTLKQVIVPIDFSSAAQNALEYAFVLAENLNAYITLLHVNRPETRDCTLDDIDPNIANIKEEMLDSVIERMNKQLADSDNSKPLIRKEFQTGFAADVILEQAKTKEGSIIVMGTTGSTGNLKKLLGSVSTKVAQKSNSPVILVPPSCQLRKLDRILYLASDEQLDATIMDELLTIAHASDAMIDVLHFSGKSDSYDQVDFLNLLKNHYPKSKIKYNQINEKISSESINNFAKANNTDLVVISKKTRSKLENLFHKSMTYELSFMTQFPLLILHEK